MLIKSAEFILSVAGPKQYPTDKLPEIALVGRSNVGKSSLINCLINRKGLAKTSSTPGKTRLLNFYLINKEFYFVDLPGYGYAKVKANIKESWGRLIEDYLAKRENLAGVLQLVDIRHKPTKDDIMMQEWLQYHELPTLVVATKLDKITRPNWKKHLQETKTALQTEDIILFSSQTRQGKEEVLRQVAGWTRKEEN